MKTVSTGLKSAARNAAATVQADGYSRATVWRDGHEPWYLDVPGEAIKRNSLCAGFSLVEVALALLVAGVGLLSVFALFPAGMDMNKKAIDDSQTGLYAEDVLNGFRAKAAMIPWNQVGGGMWISCSAPTIWNNGSSMRVRTGYGTNIYEFTGYPIVDYAIRYNMVIAANPGGHPNIKYFHLALWNGVEGATNNPSVFYTEIYNTDLAW